MRVRCSHGYFFFQETAPGEASRFVSLFGLDLVAKDNYLTFADLEDAPEFSISGGLYLGAPATKTFAGKPWDVMRENGLIYNYDLGLVVAIETVTVLTDLKQVGRYYLSPGLIFPGSLTAEGKRVTDYAAWFSTDLVFRYTEVTVD